MFQCLGCTCDLFATELCLSRVEGGQGHLIYVWGDWTQTAKHSPEETAQSHHHQSRRQMCVSPE